MSKFEPIITADRKNSAIIFGASGFVGKHLYNHLMKKGWNVVGTYHKNPHKGLIKYSLQTDSNTLSLQKILKLKAKIGIICGTYGSIDACKRDIKESRAVNVDGTIKLIEEMDRFGIKPVFCSTDYVFSGDKGNYVESDHTDPVTVYGSQKAEVENIIREKYKNALIVRFSKILSADPNDNSILSQWYRAIKEGEEGFTPLKQGLKIRCANDQFFSPTYIGDIVEGMRLLLEKNSVGTFHLCQPIAYNRLTLLKEFASYLKITPTPCKFEESSTFFQSEKVPTFFQFEECPTSAFNFLDNRSKNTSMNPQKFLNEISGSGFNFSMMDYCFELFNKNIK